MTKKVGAFLYVQRLSFGIIYACISKNIPDILSFARLGENLQCISNIRDLFVERLY